MPMVEVDTTQGGDAQIHAPGFPRRALGFEWRTRSCVHAVPLARDTPSTRLAERMTRLGRGTRGVGRTRGGHQQ